MARGMRKAKVSDRCRWCGKKHPGKTESFCFVQNERAIRTALAPAIKSVREAYLNGRLRPEFMNTTMEAKLMRWQRKMAALAYESLGQNGYRPAINIRHIMDHGMVWNQVIVEKPWAVYLIADGVRKRRRFGSLYSAIEWHREIVDKYPSSGVVSLGRAYPLPAQYRFTKEKLPKRFKWCPWCVTFRVYRRVEPAVKFEAAAKKWMENKGRYEWTHRLVWLTECELCGHTNREPAFRTANLPYDKVVLNRRGKVVRRHPRK